MIVLQPILGKDLPSCSCLYSISSSEKKEAQKIFVEPIKEEECIECLSSCTRIRPQAIVQYAGGNYMSLRHSYGLMGVMLPAGEMRGWKHFTDLRAFCLDDGKWGASGGMGIRKEINAQKIVGFNTFLDCRRGDGNHDFFQLGFGGEWLTPCLDFRLNAYIPLGARGYTLSRDSYTWPGGYAASYRRLEYSFGGGNLEVGASLFSYDDYRLYVTGGTYFLTCPQHASFWGVQGGAKIEWRSLVSAEVRITHDDHFATNAQGIFSLHLPLDCFCKNPCFDLLNQFVRRNSLILTHKCDDWIWNW